MCGCAVALRAVLTMLSPHRAADQSPRTVTTVAAGKVYSAYAMGPWYWGGRDPPTDSETCTSGLVQYEGTSMATPVVAGSAALVRQYFLEGFYPTGACRCCGVMMVTMCAAASDPVY